MAAHFPITHLLGRVHSCSVSRGRLLFATKALRNTSRDVLLPVCYHSNPEWARFERTRKQNYEALFYVEYKARERIHRGVADPRLLVIPAS